MRRRFIVLLLAFLAHLPSSATVPYRLGVAGYTYHKVDLDRTLEAMRALDVHCLCAKDFHFPLDASQEEIDSLKEKCRSYGGELTGAGPIYMDSEEAARKAFSVAAPLSQIFTLGCIAQRLNRSLRFDPVARRFIGDDEANRLLDGPAPRRGWEEYFRV